MSRMESRRFDEAAHLACTKQIDFAEFAKRTEKDVDNVVRHFTNTWPIPPWVTPEDVRQEVLTQAWRWIEKWDVKRGQPAGRFVLMQTIWRVKRAMQRAMGVSTHRATDSKGKIWRDHEVRIGATSDDVSASAIDRRAAHDSPNAEHMLIEEERRRARYDYVREALCDSSAEVVAVCALEKYDGDARRAALAIHNNEDLRAECGGIVSAKQAERLVQRTVDRIVAAHGQVM